MELNKEQKQAAEHDKGPLLIIAGAGTGKTRVITSRIIELFNNGKAGSNEILALTFTEKAANEMVTRIDEAMPLGYTDFTIKTFHAFSEQILREYGMEIGLDPGFKLLDETSQWLFFKKNLYDFALDYYRPLGNPNKFIYDLLNHFSKLKDELITPEKYLEYAEKIEEEEEKMKMMEVAKTYKKYQELMVKNNYMDFGDLTYYAIQLLNKRKSVLKKYQERFKYVLVDEFQDTNYAQFELVMLLASEHENIVVVGDDDQSIYKWRGASLSNILQFEKHFPKRKNVVLNENYRSSQKILNAAYALIQNNNPDRLEAKAGIDKKLKAIQKYENPVEVHHFPSFVMETSFVVEKIKEMHKEGGEYSDSAILIRTNQMAGAFVDELKANGIPYQVRNPKGLLSLNEIKDLVAVIRFLANPRDDISFLRILKLPVYDLPMTEILAILNNPEREHLWDFVNKKTESLQLPGVEDGVKKIQTSLLELLKFSKDKSVGEVLNEFMNKCGYLQYLIDNDKYDEMENINQFSQQVGRFCKENSDNSVVNFTDYLSLLEESESYMPLPEMNFKDAVQIITCHGAKGLEFENVFIVNAVNERFPGRKRGDVFEIPEELTKEIFPEGDVRIQEERRLFYVAMTRAKQRLFVTYSDQYEGPKKWKVSTFVKEILESKDNVKQIDHNETEDAITKLKNFKEPKKPIFDLPPFKSTKISYSQLDSFKMCPLKYNYGHILNVPVPPSHATSFGSSVHGTLNEFYQLLKNGQKVDFKDMEKLYDKNWIPYGYDSKEHEKIRKEKGLEILKNFYEKNSKPFVIPYLLEQNFTLKIGNYYLRGRIDRIDKLEDGTYEVIDYKTGRVKTDLNLKKDLQLSIYALACRDVFKIPVSRLSLYFLEENEKISSRRTNEEIDAVIPEILEAIKEIQGSKFAPTPGFHCKFCEFRLICPAV